MFVLYTWQDMPIYCGLLMRRTYPVLGTFDTHDDAVSYAHNVCGFTDSDNFFVTFEDIEELDTTLIEYDCDNCSDHGCHKCTIGAPNLS